MDSKARGIYRLQKKDWTLSQMRQLKGKGPWDLDGESTTIKKRKVARQDVKIQIEDRSSVCLFPFSSCRN